jgi:GDP/GTP exchange factor Sec2p
MSNESPSDQVLLGVRQEILRKSISCDCKEIINPDDIKTCKKCGIQLKPIQKLLQDNLFLTQELGVAKAKVEKLLNSQERNDHKLAKKMQSLKEELDLKSDELLKTKLDMEILGQKLIDEIEKRAEIQHGSENVNAEIEELTQSLFEEANTLVANEARERSSAQEKTVVMAKQLAIANTNLLVEQAQVRELRARVSQLEEMHEAALKAARPAPLEVKVAEPETQPDELFNDMLFRHFEDLVIRAPKLQITKIHDLTYMRNALEDDVTPCLRFGGNPRTSTKKFIDAILANTCFIEEMNNAQINELVERDAKFLKTSQEKKEKKEQQASTPTTSLFNKTMLERITTALTSPAADSTDQSGCSTCGIDQVYRYRFKISDVQQDLWYPICLDCRSRLHSVVDFYQFIRNMRQGLFTSRSSKDLYFESLSLKRKMFYTRIGAGSVKNPDSVFKKIIPVRPNSAIMVSYSSPALIDDLSVLPPPLEMPEAPSGFSYSKEPRN